MIVAVGKGIDWAHRYVFQAKTSEIALDVGNARGRSIGSREYGRRGARHVVRTRRFILSLVPSVGAVGLRQRTRTSRVLFDTYLNALLSLMKECKWRLRTERPLQQCR